MWPVRPRHTSSYDGLGVMPPAYPTDVDQTPGIRQKISSAPQKQPSPKSGDLGALGDLVGVDHRGVEHHVLLGEVEPGLRAAGQGLRRGGQGGLLAVEHGRSLLRVEVRSLCHNTAGRPEFPFWRRTASPGRPMGAARCVTQEHRHKSGFETRAIHAGHEPDPTTGAVIPPIYATTTYKQDGVGGLRGGYEYCRSRQPDPHRARGRIAALEEGERGFAFASGLAAEDTLLRAICRPGDHVVIPDDAYGGTYRLFDKVERAVGARAQRRPGRPTSTPCAPRSGPGETKVVWVETPTNPLLNIGDIEALAAVAHDAGALLVVDNTFASPYLQQPLALGADVVVHSTTKYCGGHSDVVGGALVVRDLELAERIAFHQNAIGAVAGPFDAWLVLRGLKTLGGPDGPALRQRREGRRVPRRPPARSPRSSTRGSPSTPGTRSPAGRCSGSAASSRSGSPAGSSRPLDVCAPDEVFTLGESLGGVESLIEHPGRMTHASVAGTDSRCPAT